MAVKRKLTDDAQALLAEAALLGIGCKVYPGTISFVYSDMYFNTISHVFETQDRYYITDERRETVSVQIVATAPGYPANILNLRKAVAQVQKLLE